MCVCVPFVQFDSSIGTDLDSSNFMKALIICSFLMFFMSLYKLSSVSDQLLFIIIMCVCVL